MTAQPRFRPVLVHDADREAGMKSCPSEDVLILYTAALPDDEPESEELLEGWTAAALSSHLGTCEDCRRRVTALGELTGALRADQLEAPPEAFWDDMTSAVMSSIDGAEGAADGEGAGNVIPLHRSGEPAPAAEPTEAPASPVRRDAAWWRWAAAALLMVGAGLTWFVLNGPPGGDDGALAVADGEGLVPTADEAALLAAELGIELASPQTDGMFADEVLDVGAAIDEAGWSSLRRDLEKMDVVGELELALVADDPIEELIELDAEELALLLEALETNT